MSITIKDVAQSLDIAPSTVSKVLNGTGSVGKKTKQRVLEAVKKMNYAPNESARQLRTKDFRTIGVIVPEIKNEFYSYLIEQIEEQSRVNSYSMLLGISNYQDERKLSYYDLLSSKNISGFVITLADQIKHYDNGKNIIVTIDEQRKDDNSLFDVVSIDNRKAMSDLTQYLINLGHRDIAYLSGQFDKSDTICLRYQGYIDCMKENDIPTQDHLNITNMKLDFCSAYDLVKKMLYRTKLPTAIMCHNNEIAYAAYKAIEELGYKIPEDISLACFDSIDHTGFKKAKITCVIQPIEKYAFEAVKLIIAKVTGEIPRNECIRKVLDYEIEFGDTVKKI